MVQLSDSTMKRVALLLLGEAFGWHLRFSIGPQPALAHVCASAATPVHLLVASCWLAVPPRPCPTAEILHDLLRLLTSGVWGLRLRAGHPELSIAEVQGGCWEQDPPPWLETNLGPQAPSHGRGHHH